MSYALLLKIEKGYLVDWVALDILKKDLLRLFIDIICFILGVHDLLAVIQAKISRQHIAERNCEQKVRHPLIAEHLEADQQ